MLEKTPKLRWLFLFFYLLAGVLFLVEPQSEPPLLRAVLFLLMLFGCYLTLCKIGVLRDPFEKTLPNSSFDVISLLIGVLAAVLLMRRIFMG